jgi:hypothetical protein
MAMCYEFWSATTAALTAPPVAVASSAVANTVRTVMQIKGTMLFRVKEWGYTLTAQPAAPCIIELIDTGAIPATMATAFVAGDAVKYNDVNSADAPPFTLATNASGFGVASVEGTITATRLLDFQYENGLYVKKQIPLGLEPEVPATNYLRLRITPTTASAVSILGYVLLET